MPDAHLEIRENGRGGVRGAIVNADRWSRDFGRPKAWIPLTAEDAALGLDELVKRYTAGTLKPPEAPKAADGPKRPVSPIEEMLAFARRMNPGGVASALLVIPSSYEPKPHRATLREKIIQTWGKFTAEDAKQLGYSGAEIAANGLDRPKRAPFKGKPLASVQLTNADLFKSVAARAMNQNPRLATDVAYECQLVKTAAGVRIDVLRVAE